MNRDSKTNSSTVERAVAIAIGLQLLISAGYFDLHFSSGIITTCKNGLAVAYLAASILPERNIDIMVSSRSDSNL